MIAAGTLPTGRACVPGCGRLRRRRFGVGRHVTGLDVSKTAKAAADAYLSSVNVSADKAQVIIVRAVRTVTYTLHPYMI